MDPLSLTATELCALFAVLPDGPKLTGPGLNRLVKSGLPRNRKGQFNLVACAAWALGRRQGVDLSALPSADAARALGITPRQLGAWKANGCPAGKRGGRLVYDLPAVCAWARGREEAKRAALVSPKEAKRVIADRLKRARAALLTVAAKCGCGRDVVAEFAKAFGKGK